ncbi:serine/threonine protein phosphatase [bacterium]|nr:serine/threonine protein phosphatase [bacterium]
MRTLAIGDIHGCLTALETLLSIVPIEKDDRIVFLGDYVDRGPDSRGVIDRILEQRRRNEVICLTGNHEIMMRDARFEPDTYRSWLGFGGEETLESYADDPTVDPSLKLVPDRHWRFLDRICEPYFETDTHIFVHANAVPDLPLNEQSELWLHWEKFADRGPHQSGKQVICGHTSQKSGWPLNVGHAMVIDTWVYGDGWLTCLDVDQGTFWQANQKGEHRGGPKAS